VLLFFIHFKSFIMQLQTATRIHTKIKMALQGPSGSGKTYSALLIAFGLCGDWNKIAVIDTENQSAHLYAALGKYQVLAISAPYTPEKFIDAIRFCEDAEIQVIILDSLSHEWEGGGGILDAHSKMAGNSFTNWSKVTPRHNALIESILQSKVHIIATLRTKQDYILTDKNGKQVPEKVGLRAIQRDGTDYEFTLVFDIDIKHHATSPKDRTGLFIGKPESVLTPQTGEIIQKWCKEGVAMPTKRFNTEGLVKRINECCSLEELLDLFTENPDEQENLLPDFTRKRQQLQRKSKTPSTQPSKAPNNGTNT
jgi:hypothetical protein